MESDKSQSARRHRNAANMASRRVRRRWGLRNDIIFGRGRWNDAKEK